MHSTRPTSRRRVFLFCGPSFRVFLGQENAANLIEIPGYGTLASLEDSLYAYRYGHVRLPPLNDEHADLMRRVDVAVWAPKDDVDPYSLAAGYDRDYRGGHFTLEMHERARDNIARTAAAEQIRKGAKDSGPITLLAVAAIISVASACLVWLSIPLIGLFT
jgi:hypothetical protein